MDNPFRCWYRILQECSFYQNMISYLENQSYAKDNSALITIINHYELSNVINYYLLSNVLLDLYLLIEKY